MGQHRNESAPADPRLALRRFHWTSGGRDGLPPLPVGVKPRLLAHVPSPERLRHAFPLHVPAEAAPELGGVRSVTEWLDTLFAEAGLVGDAHRILSDNRLRLEKHVRACARAGGDAAAKLGEAGRALGAELALSEAHDARLTEDLASLREAASTPGTLIGLGDGAPLALFLTLAANRHTRRWRSFQERRQDLLAGLRALLQIEAVKAPDTAARVSRFGVGLVDPARLSETLGPWRGTERMSSERRGRVEEALRTLEGWDERVPPVLVLHDRSDVDTAPLPAPVALRQCTHPAGEATAVFDECVRECRTLFGAVRIAELEMEARYRSDVHDPWFDAFDWARFSDAERALLPAVIALDTTERLTGTDMAAFSRMLRSKRPVHVFVSLRPDGRPADPSASPLELGYVAISHREACVHQGSVAAPLELAAGFAAALERPRPAVHLIDTGSPTAAVGQWLSAASALEGRAHPIFRYDPDAGSSWSARFRLDGNPQPERDWPAYPPPEDEAPGDVSITFADHALLVSERTDAFRVIPDDVPEEDLVPLTDALDASDAHAERVPFVVGVDGNGRATRLAVSHTLLLETRRRRDFWHTLQELGGIHNAYVEAASREVRADVEAAAAADLEKLLATHEADIQRTRTHAARDAMAALARTLLGLDAGVALTQPSVASGVPSGSVATPPPTTDAPEPAAVAETTEEEAEETFVEDAWIDTPLCTSCNDCTAINPRLFVYDGNKQAMIGDRSAGTYAELVQAAEKCPARCIHPGQPIDPDEPGLEALVARAAPFNT